MKHILKVITTGILIVSNFTCFAMEEISVYVDDIKIELDVAPIVRNNRTLVPLRFITESLGAQVSYDNNTNSIFICSPTNLVTYYHSNNKIWYKSQIDVDGNPCGYGTSWGEYGNLEYTEKFDDGLFDGEGCLYEDNKVKYIGDFLFGVPHGYGKLYDSNINLIYDGEFKNGNPLTSEIENIDNMTYGEAYGILINWGNSKVQEIYQEGDRIYNEVLQEEIEKAYAQLGINLNDNSFAAVNAKRQIEAMM